MGIVNRFSINQIVIIIIAIVFIFSSYLVFNEKFERFDTSIKQLKLSHESSVKDLLKKEIVNAVELIEYERKTTSSKLKNELKEKVYAGYHFINGIVEKLKDIKSDEEILQIKNKKSLNKRYEAISTVLFY